MTTDQTAAHEVLARLLCAADAHVHGNAPWEQLYTTVGRGVQDGYRDAARWLLPRMTVATVPAAAPVPPPADRAALLDHIAKAVRSVLPMSSSLTHDVVADAVLAVLPEQTDRAALPLTAVERQFLTFALDQAADEMALGDGFTAEDEAALEKLRRVAAEEQPAPCAECGHPKAVHREGEDPVTPGECSACLDDDARHDHRPAVGEQPETQETP